MMRVVPYRKVMREVHTENIAATLPGAVFGSWDFTMPFKHVSGPI